MPATGVATATAADTSYLQAAQSIAGQSFLLGRKTIRGLHYQLQHAQAKLCRVVEGEVLDVAVDIRVGSPYFGKWVSVMLSAEEQNQIYIREVSRTDIWLSPRGPVPL